MFLETTIIKFYQLIYNLELTSFNQCKRHSSRPKKLVISCYNVFFQLIISFVFGCRDRYWQQCEILCKISFFYVLSWAWHLIRGQSLWAGYVRSPFAALESIKGLLLFRLSIPWWQAWSFSLFKGMVSVRHFEMTAKDTSSNQVWFMKCTIN